MRTTSLIFAAALALAACNGFPGNVTTPGNIADTTRLDEQVGITATNAYTAATKLGTALAKAGLIDKVAFKKADQKGYDAVLALRTAYQAGNAPDYASAAATAWDAVAQISALVK